MATARNEVMVGLDPVSMPVEWRISNGLVAYEAALAAMDARAAAVADRIAPELVWLLEHPPLYTAGTSAKPEELIAPRFPVHTAGRGGQITYHGPGQLVAYLLFDLRRRGLGVRGMVRAIEASVIDWFDSMGISSYGKPSAPGVYVSAGGVEAKIAALGLRVRNGCTYHGLALNVAMDLSPFAAIDPCGYKGLAVTQLKDLGVTRTVADAGAELAPILAAHLRQ